MLPLLTLCVPAAAVIRDFIKRKPEPAMTHDVATLVSYSEMVTTFDTHAAAWGYVCNNFGVRSTLVLPKQGMALIRLDSLWRPYISCLGGLKEWLQAKERNDGKPPKPGQLGVWDLLLVCERTRLGVSTPMRQLFRFVCLVTIEHFYHQLAAGAVELPKRSPVKDSRPSIDADLPQLLDWFTVFSFPQYSILRKGLIVVSEAVSVAVVQLLRHFVEGGKKHHGKVRLSVQEAHDARLRLWGSAKAEKRFLPVLKSGFQTLYDQGCASLACVVRVGVAGT